MANIIRKLHDLFLVGRGGGKHYLKPKKNYIMTRQGKLREVKTSIADPEAPITFEILSEKDLAWGTALDGRLSKGFVDSTDTSETIGLTTGSLTVRLTGRAALRFTSGYETGALHVKVAGTDEVVGTVAYNGTWPIEANVTLDAGDYDIMNRSPSTESTLVELFMLPPLEIDSSVSLKANADNANTLLILGDRGDLRQLETIQRNISALFSNAATSDDTFFKIASPVIVSPSIPQATVQDLKVPTELTAVIISGVLDPSVKTIGLLLDASDDGISFERVGEPLYTPSVDGATFESTLSVPRAYRYYKWGRMGTPPIDVKFKYGYQVVPKFLGRDESARLSELIAETYDLSIWNEGGVYNDEVLVTFSAPQKLSLPAGIAGSVGKALSNPSAAFGMDMLHNGSKFGVMTLNKSGALTASNAAKVFNKGDRFSLKTGVIGDALLKDLALTLVFKRIA